MEIADIMAKAFPAKRTVRIAVRGDLIERIEDLNEQWEAAVQRDMAADRLVGNEAPALYDELVQATEEAEAEKVTFSVQSIGKDWGRLVRQHPPTDDEMVEGWKWNLETFPPAALAACCLDPVMTDGEAAGLIEVLREGEFEKLFGAVLALNLMGDLVPKLGRGTDTMPPSEPTSTTPHPEGSPTPSS